MASNIVVKLKNNYFGFGIDSVIRVINVPLITPLPNDQNYIDGLITFDGESIKVVNFRTLLEYKTMDEELIEKIDNLFNATHLNKDKIDQLLEQWINKTTKEIKLNQTLKELKSLYLDSKNPIEEHLQFVRKNILKIVNKDQKLLIYTDGVNSFGIKVDEIDKIIDIDVSEISMISNVDQNNKVLKLKGIYEDDQRLIYLVDKLDFEVE